MPERRKRRPTDADRQGGGTAATNDLGRSGSQPNSAGRQTGRQTVPTPYAAPKRCAAEFWVAYRSHVEGEHGGPVDDPGNYWDFGALGVSLDDYDLPPGVIAAWHAARDAHEAYVGLVAVFDELDADHWTRWDALRRALPGVPHAAIRRLMVLLADVPTTRLAAIGATPENGATP